MFRATIINVLAVAILGSVCLADDTKKDIDTQQVSLKEKPASKEPSLKKKTEQDSKGSSPKTKTDQTNTPRFPHVIAAETEYYESSPAQGRPADGKLKAGTKVIVIEKAGSYVRVKSAAGIIGFVAAGSLKPIEEGASLKPVGDFVKVFIRGKLKTGIVAIGGETTGTIITSGNITWELNLGDDERLRQQAEEWNEKPVMVTGMLTRKKGVEIKERWIVDVAGLKGVESANKKQKGEDK